MLSSAKIKKIIVTSSLVSLLSASQLVQAQEWEFSAGFGAYTTNEAWKGTDSNQGIAPLVSAKYGNWLIGENGIVSYSLLDEDDFGLAMGMNYRNDGYDDDKFLGSEKSTDVVFNGYDSPEGDVTFKVDGYWKFVNLSLEQDVSGNSKGLTADFGVEVPIYSLGNDFLVQASATVHWQSSDYADYIYGVSAKQVDNSVGRTAYTVGSVTNYSVGLSAFYQLDKNWSLIASVNYTKLDDAITDSPLIGDDNVTGAFIGASYRF
jgi:outer membrane scaffolding protein for murein synthesis (MipA/OmpV family)